jgi:hypothetical protein
MIENCGVKLKRHANTRVWTSQESADRLAILSTRKTNSSEYYLSMEQL